MKLNIKAVSAASALIWSGCVLIVGVANVIQPRYGKEFLQVVSSIYPGYKARPKLSQVAIGTGYAVVDGAVGGALCAWLYNRIASKCEASEGDEASIHAGPVRTAV